MSRTDIQTMRFSDLDGPHTKTIIYDHDEFIAEIKVMESSENKPPVYTQEMADAGELPPVGVECLVREGVISDVYHSCVIIAHDGSMAVFKADDNYPHSCYDGCAANMFHPLPVKTHEDLAVDDLNAYPAMLEALEEAVSIMGLFDDDICCCGSHLDDHGIGENHSYVSQYDYAVADIINKSQQAIALAKGDAY